MEKVVILGNGIAGLTAAIYTGRGNLEPLIIEGPESGGQLTLTTDVENFPGFEDPILGPDLIEETKKQAKRFGAKFKSGVATNFEKKDNCFEITIDNEEKINTKTLIIATGASARWLGLPSEQEYKGKGVTTCATCDGYFFKDKEVIVVGGGDSAMEESLFLTKFCKKITIIHRRDSFRASKIMQDKVFKNDKIKVEWNKEVVEVLGDGKLVTGVKLRDNNGEVTDFECDGVFLAIGHTPNTKIFEGKVDLDDHGYLKCDRRMKTSIPGVFGAGDVQDVIYRQAITAAGTGCQAAMEVEKFLSEQE